MMRIIDTHVHEFDLSRFRVLWLEEVPVLNRSILLEEYRESCKAQEDYEITQMIHIELDTIKEQKRIENQYFINKAKNREQGISGVVIYANLLNPRFDIELGPYMGEKVVKGVRHILHVESQPPKTCLNEIFIHNVKRLGNENLLFEACIRAEELGDLYELAKQCPNTKIVIDHMGNIDIDRWEKDQCYVENWKKSMQQLGALPNVYCKISGLSSADVDKIHEAVRHCFNSFTSKKVLFASNFPVCTVNVTLDEWVRAIMNISAYFGRAFQEELFYKNAERLYSLDDN